MKDINKIKITFITVFTALNGWLGSIATPFYILVLTNIIDYITGIGAAVYRGERVSSETGFHGIAKKVCMWLLVLVGYIVDYIIISMGNTMNIQFSFEYLIAAAVVFWLLANELISILENVADIGVPMPAFLINAVELVKEKAESSMQTDKEM